MNPLFIAGSQAAKHAIMRTLSVLCVLAVVGLLGFGVYRLLNPKPTESYAQVVEKGGTNVNIEITNPEDKFFVGFRLFGIKFGISKSEKKTMTEVVKEAKNIMK